MSGVTKVMAAIVACACVLVMAGCSTPEPEQEASEVEVTGTVGQRPEIHFDPSFEITEAETTTKVEGSGDPIPAGDPVLVDYRLVWTSGKEGVDTYDSAPVTISPDDEQTAWIYDVVAGARPGSRILSLQPGDEESGGLITVFDVLSLRARGTAQTPRADMPTVTLADNGEPTITIPPELAAPPELSVATLIKGDGEQIDAGEYVTVQTVGVSWDGQEVKNTWPASPETFPVGIGQLLKGWDEGLINITAGSQVIMVIPAAEGDVDRGTLVYVVDVLSVRGGPAADGAAEPVTPTGT